MHRVLKSIERSGTRLRLVLTGRGFYSVGSINCLKEGGRRFLMPAVKNSRVKKAILEYCKGERVAVSEFSVKNKDGMRKVHPCDNKKGGFGQIRRYHRQIRGICNEHAV